MLLTDIGLIRSSITLLVILVNLDRAVASVINQPAGVLQAQHLSQVNTTLAYRGRNIMPQTTDQIHD